MNSFDPSTHAARQDASQTKRNPPNGCRGVSARRPVSRAWVVVFGLALFFSTGCQFGVQNGEVFSGDTLGKSVTFKGTVVSPEHCVSIEVLDPADQDPFDPDSNWSTIAATVPKPSPANLNGTDLYFWSVSAVIVNNANQQERWKNGGLARTRARISYPEGSVHTHVFEDFFGCASITASAKEIIATCASSDYPVATLVDRDPLPVPTADFLSREETPNLEATEAYYQAVGAGFWGSRKTFYDFMTVNGFPGGQLGPFSDDVSAVYFNGGDLGSGRDMHCREVTAYEAGICLKGTKASNIVVRTACYVTNYFETPSLPSKDPAVAVDLAVTGHEGGGGAKATVAMERIFFPDHENFGFIWCHLPHRVSAGPQENLVRFYVYGEDEFGPALPEIALDNQGEKLVPGLCLSCHGGSPSEDDPTNIVGAEFLPFDVESFSYSTHADYRLADQRESFRELNAMVRRAVVKSPSPIVELIDGWYPSDLPGAGVLTPGALPKTDFVPSGFAGNERLYDGVVKPYCRSCHIAQAGNYAFNDSAGFAALDPNGATCGSKQMPHAQVTQEAFWNSPARMILQNELGSFDHCAPTP